MLQMGSSDLFKALQLVMTLEQETSLSFPIVHLNAWLRCRSFFLAVAEESRPKNHWKRCHDFLKTHHGMLSQEFLNVTNVFSDVMSLFLRHMTFTYIHVCTYPI